MQWLLFENLAIPMVVIYKPKNGIGINFPHEMSTFDYASVDYAFLAGERSEQNNR